LLTGVASWSLELFINVIFTTDAKADVIWIRNGRRNC